MKVMEKQLLCLVMVLFISLSLSAQNTEEIKKEDRNVKIKSSEVKVKTESNKVQETSTIRSENLKNQEKSNQPDQKKLPQDFQKY